MFIAEAPEKNENIKGIPFIGKFGEILDKLLQTINLDRNQIFITNIVKCHPPYNRNPKYEEKEQCIKWLKYEVALLKPKLIVCLGKVAAERLIFKNFSINKNHGKIFKRNNYTFIANFYPSALLRNNSKIPDAINDFKIIKNTYIKLKKPMKNPLVLKLSTY